MSFKTGAYYTGFMDGCEHRDQSPPSDWDEKAKADYNEGYEEALKAEREILAKAADAHKEGK